MQFPAYETLFRLAPQASALLDADGRICEANDAYLALVGSGRAQVCGLPAERFLACTSDELVRVRSSFLRTRTTGRSDRLELSNGWSVQHVPLPSVDGLGGLVLQAVVSAYLPIQSPDEAAKGADDGQGLRLRAVGRLACGVAHAFNNTLQVIGGNLQLLRRALGSDPAAARRLDSALEGVERGGKLASQLLDYAMRPEGDRQVFDLAAQIAARFELLSAVLGQGVDVRLQASPALWPVCADAAVFEDLLLELGACARQVMQGAGQLTVELSNQRGEPGGVGDCVVLRVAGSMNGVRDGSLAAWSPVVAAEPAGWIDTSTLQRLAAKLGGVVRSSPGGGLSDLQIRLPRAQVGEPGASESTVSSASQASDGRAQAGLRVLFVEDDPTLRMLTGEVMSELGHAVVLTGSAEEAMARLADEPFDVLFTDVGLPGIDGLELARRARAADSGLAVVIASGYAVDAAAEALHGVHCILKPYDIEGVRVLLECIPVRSDR